jgi:hypothetical protein
VARQLAHDVQMERPAFDAALEDRSSVDDQQRSRAQILISKSGDIKPEF